METFFVEPRSGPQGRTASQRLGSHIALAVRTSLGLATDPAYPSDSTGPGSGVPGSAVSFSLLRRMAPSSLQTSVQMSGTDSAGSGRGSEDQPSRYWTRPPVLPAVLPAAPVQLADIRIEEEPREGREDPSEHPDSSVHATFPSQAETQQ